MLAKKPNKNEMDKNDEIAPEKKAEKKTEKKAGKKDEKKKTEEFSLIPTAALPSPPKLPSEKERNASARQTLLNKISKRRDEQEKFEKRQQEKEENGPEEERYTTTEDGQPPLTAVAKTKSKSVSKTQTEAVEIGGTQTTQNSI
uniref:Uncharacterized protein n=1 Tax=Panagrolaimus davidi TaxID=227884 RepID=A0A914QXV5_9BILA